MCVSQAKTQISLGVRKVCSESSISTALVTETPSFLHSNSEDRGQTELMPKLISLLMTHNRNVGFLKSWLISQEPVGWVYQTNLVCLYITFKHG